MVADTLACTAAVQVELQLQSVCSSSLRLGTLDGGLCVRESLRLCGSLAPCLVQGIHREDSDDSEKTESAL